MTKKLDPKSKLKLTKHRHKARIKARRPAHRKFFLHPATVMVVLIVGVLLSAWTLNTSADSSVTVNGVIPAAPLTEAAVILSPKNGQHFGSKPITVSGSCPYKSYVKLYRNDIFSGTAICSASGGFSLQTDLSEGANILSAHIFNVTDLEGPLSDSVTVYYNRSGPASKYPALSLSSDYRYVGYDVNQEVNWSVKVVGGVAPFAFNVKWGDGNESNYVAKDNSDLNISHTYSKAGTFAVKINASDSVDQTAFLQLTALIVNQRPQAVAAGAIIPPTSHSKGALWLVWPFYLIILLMILSFWLGEREEYYRMLRKQSHRRLHY